MDLVLKAACEGCGSPSDLYGTGCKHTTLCSSCGKSMALSRARCRVCSAPVTNLIREYNVRANASTDKNFSIARFVTGLPPFSKKKSAENKWSLHKDGLQGRQFTDNLREKYNRRPWILEDETGQYQYQGQMEGSQSATATYYLLMMQGKEFHAIPAGSWYNFSKVAQYKQLTLEEAEEKMNKRRHNATGYERWMMKAATTGAAAFGAEMNKVEGASKGAADVARPKKEKKTEDENHSDKGEEDAEEEAARKSRLGLTKKNFDDEEDGGKDSDFDLDDDDIEKGDDWEHEETFTDDDEAVGNDAEERGDLAPEIPAPPEIKQDEEEENEEEDGELSKSGKELKKLLGRAAGLNESDADDDEEEEEEDESSPVLAPKQKEQPKDEPVENSPSKPTPTAGPSRNTPQSKSKQKRKAGGDDGKTAINGAATKKAKVEAETKTAAVKDESSPKATAASKASVTTSKASTSSVSPVTEDEIRAVLLAVAPVTAQDLVARFKSRLKSKQDKDAFAEILKKISKIQKLNGQNYVILGKSERVV